MVSKPLVASFDLGILRIFCFRRWFVPPLQARNFAWGCVARALFCRLDAMRSGCSGDAMHRLAGAPASCRHRAALMPPLQKFLSLFLLLLLPVVVTGCSQGPVKITQVPPEIKTEYFDKGARPPEANTPDHNDCANTHWHYSFIPKINWELIKRERALDGENVTVKIKSVDLTLKLPITMWLPEKASEDVLAHEKGHAAICIDIYKQANRVAEEAAGLVVGKEFGAHGNNYEEALKNLQTELEQMMASKYREDTLDRANVTSAFYDKITMADHAASKVNSKVEDAELEYERLAPELRKQRAEDERKIRELIEKQKLKQKEHAAKVGENSQAGVKPDGKPENEAHSEAKPETAPEEKPSVDANQKASSETKAKP